MATEIERKFLVTNEDYKNKAASSTQLVQGYLSSIPERTVRVRINGQKGYMTVKGAADTKGLSRYEWEKEIPIEEANQLLQLCEPSIIEKVRYIIPAGRHRFEVDEFSGENKGLVIAEIELGNEGEIFEKPEWLGPEVTGEEKYYNAMLSKNPFTKWTK